MGLILDTSVLIEAERKRVGPEELLQIYRSSLGETGSALSAITVAELTHGIYRAQSFAQAAQRDLYVQSVCAAWTVHPIDVEIAKLAGKIEGEQAARGEILALADILIGATALYLNFSVVTLNIKHFQKIPGLHVVAAPVLR